MDICISKLTIIGSDNGLPHGQRQAIWTSGRILLIRNLRINFNGILIEIHIFHFQENAFENVLCEMAVILPQPQCVNDSVNLAFSLCNKAYSHKMGCYKLCGSQSHSLVVAPALLLMTSYTWNRWIDALAINIASEVVKLSVSE